MSLGICHVPTEKFAVYSAQCTGHSVQGTVYSAQCTVHSVQGTVCSAQCTVHSVQGTVYRAQCTVHSVQCTVYSAQCTGHSVHVPNGIRKCTLVRTVHISGEKVTLVNNFLKMAPSICWYSVWYLFLTPSGAYNFEMTVIFF